jgi:hypothetical protein
MPPLASMAFFEGVNGVNQNGSSNFQQAASRRFASVGASVGARATGVRDFSTALRRTKIFLCSTACRADESGVALRFPPQSKTLREFGNAFGVADNRQEY